MEVPCNISYTRVGIDDTIVHFTRGLQGDKFFACRGPACDSLFDWFSVYNLSPGLTLNLHVVGFVPT